MGEMLWCEQFNWNFLSSTFTRGCYLYVRTVLLEEPFKWNLLISSSTFMYYVLNFLGDTFGSCSSQSNKLTIYMHLRFVHSGSVDQNMTWDITVKNKPLTTFPLQPWVPEVFFSCVWWDASLSAAGLFARVTIKTRATKGGNRGWKVSGSHGNFSWVWRLVKCFTFQIHYQTPRQREN